MGRQYHGSWFKMFLRNILKCLVEFTTGRAILDINSGFRVFSRKVSMSFFDQLCDTFSFSTGMTLAYMMTVKYVAHVPIPYGNRTGKSKVRMFRDSLRTLQYIVEAILFYNPLKIFIVLCSLTVLFSLVFFSMAYLVGLENGVFFGTLGILVTLVLFALGLLSILLSRNLSLRK